MLGDPRLHEWRRNLIKAIIDHFGPQWFAQKKVLDLGCGYGEVGGALLRLGAFITAVDARPENLGYVKQQFPAIKTLQLDLNSQWSFHHTNYDLILSIDLLPHLSNWEQHITNICRHANNIVIETEISNSNDPNYHIPTTEDRHVNSFSFHGEGVILTAATIENKLSDLMTSYKRIDHNKLNSNEFSYDWQETNTGERNYGQRRLWFVRQEKTMQDHFDNQAIMRAVEQQAIPPAPAAPQPLNLRLRRQASKNARVAQSPPKRPPLSSLPPFVPAPRPPNMPKVRLFYNYYTNANPERQKEIDLCLQKNIDNSLLDIIVLDCEERPTYNFFFEKINKLAGENDISIFCNSDIFFDNTILSAINIGAKDMYALSRWEWKTDGKVELRNLKNSQDAWIVRGKVEGVNGDIKLGTYYCDNRIAYEFNKAGYKVSNPCKSVKAYHIHNTEIRDYPIDLVPPGPILMVEPSGL